MSIRVRFSHYAYEVSANQTDNTFTRIIRVMAKGIKAKVPNG